MQHHSKQTSCESTPAPLARRGRDLPESDARSSPFRRVHLLALMLLCTAMLAGGAADLPLASDGTVPPPAVSPAFQSADVARAVANANPTLSDREVDRVASAVMRYSEKYGLAPDLVTAILVVESGARPWARSPKGAMGLMQVMPYMLNPMGLAGNPTTIETNIEAGCFILAENIDRWGEERGISAYFWGTDVRGLGYLERVKSARFALHSSPTT